MQRQVLILETKANDITCYADAFRAANHLEPEDVEEGVFRVFDVAGRELGIGVADGRVVITNEIIDNHPDQVAEILRVYLSTVRSARGGLRADDLRRADLSALIDQLCAGDQR